MTSAIASASNPPTGKEDETDSDITFVGYGDIRA